MKKIFNFIAGLFLVFTFIACESSKIDKINEKNIVEINFGELPEKTREIEIHRRVKGEEDWGFRYITVKDLNKTSVKDYFTEPGTTYEYKIVYYIKDDRGNWSSTNIIVEKTSENGYGELEFSRKPEASYNEETTILDFFVLPEINKKQEEFINSKKGNFKSWIYYVENNKDDREAEAIYFPIMKEVDCANNVISNNFDTPLYLNSIDWNVEIDGIRYYTSIDGAEFQNVPQIIKVKDLRPKLKLENCPEGTKIYLPEEVKIADYCTITGLIYGEGKVFRIYVDLTKLKNNDNLTIINYFTVPGKKYVYDAVFDFHLDDGSVKRFSTDRYFITAESGCGYLDFDSKFKSQYDEEKEIMTFKDMPKLLQGDFIKSKGGNYKVYIRYQLQGLNNGETVDGLIDEEGKINWKEELKYKNWYEKTLIPAYITPKVNIDNYEYEAYLEPRDYYKDVLSGLTNPLIVHE